MATRRRKRKYTWFPIIGSSGPGEPPTDNFNQQFFNFDVAPDGTSFVGIAPIIPDVPLEGDDIDVAAPGQLVQAIGQEYVVERIVGKLFIGINTPADDPPTTIFPRTFLVGAGFFVARAADANAGSGPNQPIGAASLAERQENYSPLSEESIREPWMWRRTWLLNSGRPNANTATASGAFQPVLTAFGGFPGAPKTNIEYGSALDGPHFDVKSVRRVGNDERLWFVVAGRTVDVLVGVPPTPNTVAPAAVAGCLDFRVLGQLRRAHNKSTF